MILSDFFGVGLYRVFRILLNSKCEGHTFLMWGVLLRSHGEPLFFSKALRRFLFLVFGYQIAVVMISIAMIIRLGTCWEFGKGRGPTPHPLLRLAP